MIASGTRPQARPFLDQISLPTPANVAARDRVGTAWVAVSVGSVTTLGEGQEPESPSGKARGRGELGLLPFTAALLTCHGAVGEHSPLLFKFRPANLAPCESIIQNVQRASLA
jgi:hypothetical protein